MVEQRNAPESYSEAKTKTIILQHQRKRWSPSVIALCIIEFILLAGICVLEYFLRFTTKFPIRKQNFSCNDPDISYSTSLSKEEFGFNVDIPLAVIYSLNFCVPVIVVSIGEIIFWVIVNRSKLSKTSDRLKFTQVMQRIVRFVGVFLFGLISLMIYVDVTKMMTGKLAPNFLEVCVLDRNICNNQSNYGGDELCTQLDDLDLKYARTAFPSIYSAMCMFSAVFIVIYMHRAMPSRSFSIFRPFVTFALLMCAILCGLWEINTYTCDWIDVAVGLAAGLVLAVYLCRVTLNEFQQPNDDKLALFFEQLLKEHEEENNMKLMRNKNLQRQKAVNYNPRTRWQRAVTSIQQARVDDPVLYNSFQEDLSKSIDYYRDRRNTIIDTTEIT